MSQPYEQFNIAAVDPFLTPPKQETYFSRTFSEDLCVSRRVDHPIFSPDSDDVLDEDLYEAQIDSSDSCSTSTPEPSTHHSHSLDSNLFYPVALPSTPHTHEYKNQHTNRLETAHIHGIHEHEHQSIQRPNDGTDSPFISPSSLPYLSSTTSDFIRPAPMPQSYVRRRSLSHSDIDQLIDHPPNPALVRLQKRRARSTTPEEKRRPVPYPTHGRAASGGHFKGILVHAPSMSRGNSHVNKMAPMHNGASLNSHNETLSGAEGDYDPLLDDEFFLSQMLSMHQNGPAIRYMTDLHDLERSRHIIEIGAMSAVSRPRDVLVEQMHGETELECMLKILEGVERHFRERNADLEVLEACTKIRETLVPDIKKEKLDEDVHVVSKQSNNAMDAPTEVLSAEDWSVYIGDEDESGITAMLMMMEHENDLADESS